MYNLDHHRDARRIILGSAEREGSISFPFFALGSLALFLGTALTQAFRNEGAKMVLGLTSRPGGLGKDALWVRFNCLSGK